MSSNHKCARAVATILAAQAGATAFAASPGDEAPPASAGLTEVVVTAQRRSENIQDVPIAIQALTGETLQQLNVVNFDDFVKYLPNVTSSSAGPGQSQIFMRGLSVGDQGTQSGGSINGFPNVAISRVSCRAATSTCMPRTWSAWKSSKVRRARCSERAPRRV